MALFAVVFRGHLGLLGLLLESWKSTEKDLNFLN